MDYRVLANIRDGVGIPTTLSSSALHALKTIALYANRDHECFVGHATLARAMNVRCVQNERTAGRHIAELKRAGLLTERYPENTHLEDGSFRRARTYRLGDVLTQSLDAAPVVEESSRQLPAPARKRPARPPDANNDPPRFSEIWAIYPNQDAHDSAVALFRKMKPDDALIDRILTHVSAMARSKKWTDDRGRFVPLLRNYLKDKRWKDPIPADAKATTSGPGRSLDAWLTACTHQPKCLHPFDCDKRNGAARA